MTAFRHSLCTGWPNERVEFGPMNALTRNTTGMSRLVWTAGICIGASLPHWPTLPIWCNMT